MGIGEAIFGSVVVICATVVIVVIAFILNK